MKNIFSFKAGAFNLDLALLVARVSIAALMLVHGFPKLMMLISGGDIQFPPVFGLGAATSLALAVFAEVFCSLFILVGLGTRMATVPLIVTMLVAVFMIHGNDPFAKQEPALQYLLAYLVLFFAGSGRFSLDYLLQRKSLASYHPELKPEDPTVSIYQ